MAAIHVIFDFNQIRHDLLMGPTFDGSTEIHADNFAEYPGIDLVRYS